MFWNCKVYLFCDGGFDIDIFVKNFLFEIQMENIYLMRYMFIQFVLIVFLLKTFVSFDEFRSDYLK
jgi:hypothetical protein